MASDISLAVGDGARRMTYAELAQARGISLASARRLARRHHWHRQVGNDGIVRVTVPLRQLRSVPRPTSENPAEAIAFSGPGAGQAKSRGTDPRAVTDDPGTDPTPPDSVSPGTDPLTVIAIETLSQAVEMLREDVERERDRADRAERQVEVERQLVEEGRKRVDGLLIELADARIAAMISGSEAAALRVQVAAPTGPAQRPRWRRWFG